YTRGGAYEIRACVADRVEIDPISQVKQTTGASQERCAVTAVTVGAAAELDIVVEAPADALLPGSDVEFVVRLGNREFALDPADPRFAELPAAGAAIDGLTLAGDLAAGLELTAVTASDATCAIQDGGFECTKG